MTLKKLTDTDMKILIGFANNNMNASKIAKQLYMHRNTVMYHLEKIKMTTELNPLNFFELIQLMELAGVIHLQCKYFKRKEDENASN